MKMFWAWITVAPLAALFTLWSIQYATPNSGYAMPFLVMMAAAAIVLTSAVIGALTKSVLPSLGGALLGFPLAAILIFGITTYSQVRNAEKNETEEKALQTLLPAVRSGDATAISSALSSLKNLEVPVAVCRLNSQNFYLAKNELDRPSDEAVSTHAFAVAEAVAGLPISIVEKEAALYQILRRVIDSRSPGAFAKWLAVWRSAHDNATPKILEVKEVYQQNDSFCMWPTTEDLAQSLIVEWQDEGINAWLDNGLIFIEAQQRHALEAVQTSRVLKRLLATGIDIHAPDSRSKSGGMFANSLLVQRSYSFYSMINEAKDPMEVARLVETFIKAGADTKALSADDKTALQIFIETEPYLSKEPALAADERSSPALKFAAFQLIRRYLSPQ